MTASQTLDEELHAFVASHRPDLTALLTKLVSFATDSQAVDAERFIDAARACRDFLVPELEKLGLEVQTWHQDDKYPVEVGCLRGKTHHQLLALAGHFDVVPAGDLQLWETDPWRLTPRGQRLYGRGAADMKAGVATLLFALRAHRELGRSLSGDVWVHLISDEEIVGRSTREILDRYPRPDAVVNLEPTSLTIAPAQAGLVHLRIEVEGRSTHAGNRYTLLYPGYEPSGASAIDAAVTIVTALQRLERQWSQKRPLAFLPAGFNTILPAAIVGGAGGGKDGHLAAPSNYGIVSDYCSIGYNIWYLPYEQFDDIRAEVEEYLAHVAATDVWLRSHPPKLSWKVDEVFLPPVDTPPQHKIVEALMNARVRLVVSPPSRVLQPPLNFHGTSIAGFRASCMAREALRRRTARTNTSLRMNFSSLPTS